MFLKMFRVQAEGPQEQGQQEIDPNHCILLSTRSALQQLVSSAGILLLFLLLCMLFLTNFEFFSSNLVKFDTLRCWSLHFSFAFFVSLPPLLYTFYLFHTINRIEAAAGPEEKNIQEPICSSTSSCLPPPRLLTIPEEAGQEQEQKVR